MIQNRRNMCVQVHLPCAVSRRLPPDEKLHTIIPAEEDGVCSIGRLATQQAGKYLGGGRKKWRGSSSRAPTLGYRGHSGKVRADTLEAVGNGARSRAQSGIYAVDVPLRFLSYFHRHALFVLFAPTSSGLWHLGCPAGPFPSLTRYSCIYPSRVDGLEGGKGGAGRGCGGLAVMHTWEVVGVPTMKDTSLSILVIARPLRCILVSYIARFEVLLRSFLYPP